MLCFFGFFPEGMMKRILFCWKRSKRRCFAHILLSFNDEVMVVFSAYSSVERLPRLAKRPSSLHRLSCAGKELEQDLCGWSPSGDVSEILCLLGGYRTSNKWKAFHGIRRNFLAFVVHIATLKARVGVFMWLARQLEGIAQIPPGCDNREACGILRVLWGSGWRGAPTSLGCPSGPCYRKVTLWSEGSTPKTRFQKPDPLKLFPQARVKKTGT